jgi:ABC-type sugar transport system substrate-binding protein
MVVPPAEVRVNPPDPAHEADPGAETAAVGSAARRRKDIKAGTVIDASVGQFPFKVGALAVKTAVAVAERETVAKQVISPLIMVDKTNVHKFTADQRQLP